ncbi:hypothetical protein BH20ACT5_BH20ACT5_22070 [soil metagenome]
MCASLVTGGNAGLLTAHLGYAVPAAYPHLYPQNMRMRSTTVSTCCASGTATVR